MSKRIRIYSNEDLDLHSSASSCWVSRGGKVYDVTSFLPDHPGGDDLVLKYAGKDVEEVMKDSEEHEHSESAYDMLEEFLIGRLGNSESLVREDWEATDDFKPDETDEAVDFEKNQFIDLRKPLVMQVLRSNYSKSYYLQQVHQPRHLPEPARMFGSPLLEPLTRTVWYVVPIIWLPVAANIFIRSMVQFSIASPLPSFWSAPLVPYQLLLKPSFSVSPVAIIYTALAFFLGNFVWTVLEYGLHRFLFHIDEWLPDHPVFLTLHFLLHGVHHYLPMDKLRLVMPPALFALLQAPWTRLAYTLFPTALANGIISGAFTFYVLYDTMHYALHHTKLPNYIKGMKKYHLAHHYKNFELGFGVTSKIWDYVFNTVLAV